MSCLPTRWANGDGRPALAPRSFFLSRRISVSAKLVAITLDSKQKNPIRRVWRNFILNYLIGSVYWSIAGIVVSVERLFDICDSSLFLVITLYNCRPFCLFLKPTKRLSMVAPQLQRNLTINNTSIACYSCKARRLNPIKLISATILCTRTIFEGLILIIESIGEHQHIHFSQRSISHNHGKTQYMMTSSLVSYIY